VKSVVEAGSGGDAAADVILAGDQADSHSGTMDASGSLQASHSDIEPIVAPPQQVDAELGRVRARWKDYVDSLRGLGSTGHLDAFLRSACEPVSLQDDVLVLRFAHEFHKSKVEDPKYLTVVEQQLLAFFDRPFRVSCVLEEAAGDSVTAPETSPGPVAAPESLVDAALRLGGRPRNRT